MVENDIEEKPPFFKNWNGMYWLVIGSLIFYIIFLYIFTLAFS